MDVSYPTIQCTYDGIPSSQAQCLVFFSIPLSAFHSLAHNVNHFTGLSCTSSRNVMEMFYLREGYRYSLCVYVYMNSFEGDWYILSF